MTLTAQHGRESGMCVLGAWTAPCLFPLAPALTHHEMKHRDTGGTSLKTQRWTGHSAEGVFCFMTEISQGRIQPSTLRFAPRTQPLKLCMSQWESRPSLTSVSSGCWRMVPQGPPKPQGTEGHWAPWPQRVMALRTLFCRGSTSKTT